MTRKKKERKQNRSGKTGNGRVTGTKVWWKVKTVNIVPYSVASTAARLAVHGKWENGCGGSRTTERGDAGARVSKIRSGEKP